mmetsp:Transcript_69908/g.138523  ORF Transcript_69908/g.138523 Transcript_69908/m.138523 type:complete len:358 (-) Transcript_69908:188-1261(-)
MNRPSHDSANLDAITMGLKSRVPPQRWPRRRLLGAAAVLATAALLLHWSWGSPASHSYLSTHAPSTLTAASVSHRVEGEQPPPPATHPWAGATHLIMVAGHAVYKAASRTADDVRREESWYLEPFQHGQLGTMITHIRRGVELAAADNASLLIFSGGETRIAAGPRSEARSYWEAADALDWFGTPQVRERSVLEVHARDSFENLLFSLCRFYEASGRYPSRVTVVSFGFKRRRFLELHRAALRLPRSHFDYVGVDPRGLSLDTLAGELAHSSKPFERDPYGCAQPELRHKRTTRNPFRRGASGYEQSCPAIAPLLTHCGIAIFRGRLPWSERLGDEEDTGTRGFYGATSGSARATQE